MKQPKVITLSKTITQDVELSEDNDLEYEINFFLNPSNRFSEMDFGYNDQDIVLRKMFKKTTCIIEINDCIFGHAETGKQVVNILDNNDKQNER